MEKTAISSLKFPAIALIVIGVLNGLTGLLSLLSGALRLLGMTGETLPIEESERIGFVVGSIVGYGAGFLSVLAAPLIIYGSLQMLNGRKLKLVRITTLLAMFPLTSCCFLVGFPVGLYAFFQLFKVEVSKAFE